jgi:carboxymethylenebutenolidase
MREQVLLTAPDGHQLDGYRVRPAIRRKGGLVVIQEVFGVNGHIREVCEEYAGDGYEAIAPALFDRVRPRVELPYDDGGIAEGRELAAAIGWDKPMLDLRAAAKAIDLDGKVGVVGYCWGGSWAWLAGCRLDILCAVCYYGRHIPDLLDESPRCPIMMHFGAEDASIPLDGIEKIREAHPDMPIYVYEGAGHGFNCDHRPSYHAAAAALARKRTLAFFAEHL